jgi:hypothetical protein
MRQMGAGQNGLATVGSSECYGVTNGCGQHEVPGVLGSWVQHEGPGFESSDLLAVAAPAGATPTRSRCPRGPALVPCAPEAATASATSSNAHARVQLDGLAPTTPIACKIHRRDRRSRMHSVLYILPFDDEHASLARCVCL